MLVTCVLSSLHPVQADSKGRSTAQASASLQGDSHHPPRVRWLRSELYFGVGPWNDPQHAQAEKRWRDFLDREVTPRFPEGLSVVDAYGQWLPPGGTQPERLDSKILLILHPDTPAQRRNLDAIRSAWKKLTGDQSVLLVSMPVQVSF